MLLDTQDLTVTRSGISLDRGLTLATRPLPLPERALAALELGDG